MVLYGAGGHARVVLDAARAQGLEVVAAIDDREGLRGTTIDDVPIVGARDAIEAIRGQVDGMILGVGSVDAPSPRAAFYEQVKRYGLALPMVVHPSATVAPTAFLEEASVVFAGAVVNPHARIGRNVIINTAAVVEHDCVIEDHVHISPGALLAGGVSVGTAGHVGIGAVIMQGVRIGTGVMVAAGAVVLKDVPDGARVGGVPARPLR